MMQAQRTKEQDGAIVEGERLNQQQFDRFSEFIYRKCGIRISGKKVSLLSNRIRRRLRAGSFEDFDTYYRFVTSPSGVVELASFLDAVTTNETFFFRTAKHFDWLKTEFLSELLAQQRSAKRRPALRIWSAGCSTGAEPYSVAICLAESKHRLRDWRLTVLGTDISDESLQSACEGVFNSRAVESVTESQRRRYFRLPANDGLWRVRPEIREMVEFKKHNLMMPLAEPAFDCIFIRNVLIYFDRASKQVVIKHLLKALAPGGYLLVGPSEGIYDLLDSLQKVSPLLYRKADSDHRLGAPAAGGNAER